MQHLHSDDQSLHCGCWLRRDGGGAAPAHEAGLESGDIVTKLDRNCIGRPSQMNQMLTENATGAKVESETFRRSHDRTVEVRFGQCENESSGMSGAIASESGRVGGALPPELAGQPGLREWQPCVDIWDIEPGHLAGRAGLRQDDVITRLDDGGVEGPQTFHEQLGQLDPIRGMCPQVVSWGFKSFMSVRKS